LLAATSISYGHQTGVVLKDSPFPPKSNQYPFEFLVKTSTGTQFFPAVIPDDVKPAAFFPPGRVSPFHPPPPPNKVRSLMSLCFETAIANMSPWYIRDYLIAHPDLGAVPAPVEVMLQRAEDNKRDYHTPFLTCRCGRKFVVPRASWIEWWCGYDGVILPFKTQVCSWHCAEKFHISTPP
jgi:hypothetical protein